jgi:hypothetical protein
MIRSLGFQIGAVLAAVAAAVGWLKIHDAKKVEQGRNQVRVETKKANDAAVKTSDRVRARATAAGVRGQRDPNSID